jgi:hypothetical protein
VGNEATSFTDPSGLQLTADNIRVRNEHLARVEAELRQLQAQGGISADEVDYRIAILRAALFHRMHFNSGADRDPQYFIWDKKLKAFRLKPGTVADAVHSMVYELNPGQSATGCTMATRFIMLEGLAQFARKKGKLAEFEKEFGGKTMAYLYPYATSQYHRKTTNPRHLIPDTFMPGDRVWMKNHRHRSGVDPVGNEGSNVIYIGRGADGQHRFLHMERGNVETFEQLQETVRKYSPEHRRDPKLENYRFRERYMPLIPKCLR